MKYKVGDKVRVRDWEDMEKEFGVINGCINTRLTFTPEMSKFCGEEVTVSNIKYNACYEKEKTLTLSIKDNLLNFIDKMEAEDVAMEMRYGYYFAIDKFREYLNGVSEGWEQVFDEVYPSPKNDSTYLSDYVLCITYENTPCICMYDNINKQWIEKGTMKKMRNIKLWKEIK